MLIDWITARIPLEVLPEATRAKVLMIGDRISRYCPKTGDVRYETSAWDSIRSDSHQINVKVGPSGLMMMGSPARVTGDGDAVFGSGASAALSLGACVDAMRLFVQQATGVVLPADASLWIVTRIDITGNLLLDSLEEVRDALRILRDCEGGRYRVSNQAGDSVYWSHRSKMRAGKAYAKGPHLRHLMKQKTYTGRPYSPDEITEADRLLRLELKLGREWLARTDWKTLTADDLIAEWQSYFSRMIGSAEMTSDDEVKTRILAVAPTEGQGKSAYGCWLMIQTEGWERAKESYSKSAWYRHLKLFRDAGLGDADISRGQVVPLRRKVFEARLISSWADLRKAS